MLKPFAAIATVCAVVALTPSTALAQVAPDVASASSQTAAEETADDPVPWLFWAGVGGGMALLAVAWLPLVDYFLLLPDFDRAAANMEKARAGEILCPSTSGPSTECYEALFNQIVIHQYLDLGVSLALGLSGLGAVVASCYWLYPHAE